MHGQQGFPHVSCDLCAAPPCLLEALWTSYMSLEGVWIAVAAYLSSVQMAVIFDNSCTQSVHSNCSVCCVSHVSTAQCAVLQDPVVGRLYTCTTCARLQLCLACFDQGQHPQHAFVVSAAPGAPDKLADRNVLGSLLMRLGRRYAQHRIAYFTLFCQVLPDVSCTGIAQTCGELWQTVSFRNVAAKAAKTQGKYCGACSSSSAVDSCYQSAVSSDSLGLGLLSTWLSKAALNCKP